MIAVSLRPRASRPLEKFREQKVRRGRSLEVVRSIPFARPSTGCRSARMKRNYKRRNRRAAAGRGAQMCNTTSHRVGRAQLLFPSNTRSYIGSATRRRIRKRRKHASRRGLTFGEKRKGKHGATDRSVHASEVKVGRGDIFRKARDMASTWRIYACSFPNDARFVSFFGTRIFTTRCLHAYSSERFSCLRRFPGSVALRVDPSPRVDHGSRGSRCCATRKPRCFISSLPLLSLLRCV